MHGLATDVTGLLVPATWPDVFEALEKNVPSPLAGEGQGERGGGKYHTQSTGHRFLCAISAPGPHEAAQPHILQRLVEQRFDFDGPLAAQRRLQQLPGAGAGEGT